MFTYADLYPNMGMDTTAETIPEAADQQALVDDTKVAEAASVNGKKKFPILLSVLLVVVIAVVIGGAK